ncbi:hypothetical protein UT300012_23100 [Paraclostridium bifermentans]
MKRFGKPPRGKNKKHDIVDNFSNEVDDMFDDIEDEVERRPVSPKEYSSYRKPESAPRQNRYDDEYEEDTFEDEGRRRRPPTQEREHPPRGERPPRGDRPPRNNRPPGVTKPPKRNGKKKDGGGKSTIIGIVLGLFVVAVMGLALYFLVMGGMKDDKKSTTPGSKQEQTTNQDNQQFQSMEKPDKNVESNNQNTNNNTSTQPGASMDDTNAINPGLPNTETGQNKVNNGKLTPSGDFLKDVNGNQIPTNYEVKQVKEETDFVNYEKRRGVTGDGVELLWLDAEYKGVPYTVQVPFKIWKELDPKGITVVSMEVLYLQDDKKVISFMSVKDNYKELLEKKNAGSSW